MNSNTASFATYARVKNFITRGDGTKIPAGTFLEVVSESPVTVTIAEDALELTTHKTTVELFDITLTI